MFCMYFLGIFLNLFITRPFSGAESVFHRMIVILAQFVEGLIRGFTVCVLHNPFFVRWLSLHIDRSISSSPLQLLKKDLFLFHSQHFILASFYYTRDIFYSQAR